jgi:superfamily II DNA or RNA helicase
VPSDKIKKLKGRYKNGYDNIGRDLFGVCLKECRLYRRGTGFFRGSALIAWAGAIDHILKDDVKIEIICSPVVTDKNFIEILKRNSNDVDRRRTIQKLSDEIVLTAIGFGLNPDRVEYRSKLLSYLIAKGQLEFRFAIPINYNDGGEVAQDSNLYHVKVGYFVFDDGSKVAFEGSVNESDSAHQYNTESASVFRSWVPGDIERVEEAVADLDHDWNQQNPHIEVFELSKEALAIIKERSPRERPVNSIKIVPPILPVILPPPLIEIDAKWKHQDQAIEKFLFHKKGILNMATGTGKTRTALKIISKLFTQKLIETVIISTDGNDLLSQWSSQVNTLASENPGMFRIYRHFGSPPGPSFRDLNNFLLDTSGSVLITSNLHLPTLLRNLPSKIKSKVLLIHDEVHGIGSPSNRSALSGLSENIVWILGLSATPEREYDKEGNEFIESYIGPVIFEYDLKEAISDGILCPFNYYPISYQSTPEDKENIASVFAKQAAKKAAGYPSSEVDLYIELSKVYKLSKAKIPLFSSFIREHRDFLKRAIIFVEERWYGDLVMDVVHNFRPDFHTYYAEDDVETLRRFATGQLECLITCHKVSEGIDIKSLENVILFSSAKARLETIQRIGRCLRSDPGNPNKIANVVDFIRVDEGKINSDNERESWLSELSIIRTGH